jgi:flagellar basal-body rod modification protein FlgD
VPRFYAQRPDGTWARTTSEDDGWLAAVYRNEPLVTDLATNADSVKVQVRTAAGTVVDTIDLGGKTAGRHSFEWNASSYAGSTAGLTFTVLPTASNTAVTATALQRSRVESVSNDNNVLTLQLSGGKSLAYSNVKAIL